MFSSAPRFRPLLLSGLTLCGAFLLTLLAPETAGAQCSMCRTALEQNAEAAASFNRAILFLLAAPYAVFGTIAGYVACSRRRQESRGDAAAARSARPQG